MLKILLLEDDDFDAVLIEREIRAVGDEFELVHVRDKEDFVARLSSGAPTFDLILSDYSVPGLAKGAALALAQEKAGDVPFILLSSALPEESVADFLKAGATDFVNKDRLERLPLAIRRARKEAERRVDLARTQQALIEAKEAAEQANRAKDRFIATLSHELRTPLTPVLLSLELTLLDPDLTPEIAASLETMRRNLELEVQLINDLLDLTAITRGKLQLQRKDVDLRDLIASAVAICRTEAEEKGVSMEVGSAPTPLLIHADARRIQQAIWNLLRNASKFTGDGGRVSVDVRTSGGTVALTVADTGIGIAPEHFDRIFTPFDQGGQGRRGGLGLGLSIAREVLEAHGGSLTATSPGEGLGSTFTVTLPLVPSSPPDAAIPSVPSSATDYRENTQVLLVEDNVDTATLVARLLRRRGFRVDVAGSCGEARRTLGEGEYDLLISDIGLPDGTGYELRQEIPAGRLKSIALTGYGHESDVRRAFEVGFDDHFTKPVDFEALIRRIDSLLTSSGAER